MKIFWRSKLKFLLTATIGLCLSTGMAANAVANNSSEAGRRTESQLVPTANSNRTIPSRSAEERVELNPEVFHSAGAEALAYSTNRVEFCTFERFVDELELARDCGTIFAGCSCDDMGTTHGGGGCANCYR